jgi:cytochrome c
MRRLLLVSAALLITACDHDAGLAVSPGSKPVPNPLAPKPEVAQLCPCGAPAVAAAAAVDPAVAALPGANLFQTRTCIACHGKDAKTPILPVYPRIAGQQAAYIEQQMKDIKSGARSNANTAAMRGVMGLVNDEEIHLLATYVSQLPR